MTNLEIFFCFLCFFSFINSTSLVNKEHKKEGPTDALLTSESLIFISTLNGTLYAVHQSTGEIIWSLKEDPVLKIPINTGRGGPIFLANPKDGSLYSFKLGQDGLKKLPFTIPDLVSISPCKSNDGLLYTGYKKDSWFSVDLLTGSKVHVLNMDGPQEICPSNTASTIFIGRTEYTIVMFDGQSRQISWNATFMDYSSHVAMDAEPSSSSNNDDDLDIHHFASSSSGHLVTMDTVSGRVKWSHQFDSPVVGIYSLNSEHVLVTRSFHTMGLETLAHLSSNTVGESTEWVDNPTLYIGKNSVSAYALPSYVDDSTVTISPKTFGRPLLEGPDLKIPSNHSEFLNKKANQEADRNKEEGAKTVFLIGHHEVPDLSTRSNVDRLAVKLIEHKSQQPIIVKHPDDLDPYSLTNGNASFAINQSNAFDMSHDHYGYLTIVTIFNAVIFSCFMTFFRRLIATFHLVSFKVLHTRHAHTKHTTRSHTHTLTPLIKTFDLFYPLIKIEKISYNKNEVLGQGCNGTFVYSRGMFEGRHVAVKRLLNGNVDVANREVALLKESDYHPNVIRYFCMEQDQQFNYIALELCPFTLHDVIEMGLSASCDLDLRDVLKQMLSGIAHLHSLNIVHRDVKPQNVLLSCPTPSTKYRAMISDFGLCKKLLPNKNSVSKTTGATGTDGWIAPEMFSTNPKTMTKAVDVFSCGCVIHYVLSMGVHPFGDAINRQANIMKTSFNFDSLTGEDRETAKNLIKSMIDQTPEKRPTISQTLKHPLFWSKYRQLSFFEEVSDRLEKKPDDDIYVIRLESNGMKVVHFDWTKKISSDFIADMRKFRTYKRHSVRDLLRVIRNKKHHYRDLSAELKESIGSIPDGYVSYFTSRFPLLLMHTYDAMEMLKDDQALAPFY
ncbi:hypothetical protein HELRODRAFT_116619 [Helobdella robusta]|uniref:non-specific serine/threonine protein kinase n=1 Tax=Helobdella robusta TaxID=6412 RepID=T1EGG6_HELRO|nr:hypothetical protein HELRODRAFT_116619 [Helobdella robusta]ESN90088.1 hypothetical protein HELRODRAFT_116619 [Helobdella robusta]